MNTGRTLAELAAELDRQTKTRRDYIAPQSKIEPVILEHAGAPVVMLDGINGGPMPLTEHAHGQMADHLGVPKRYYDRMRAEQPHLLATNIRTWLHADGDNQRMIRALDGHVRAVLSPKFRPLDNYDLMGAILPTLIEHRVQVVSSQVTETRLYVKAILPTLSDELPVGLAWGTGHNRVGGEGLDRGRVVSAITISNSDVGAGALSIEPSVFTSWCTNMAILKAMAMKKHHVGARATAADGSYEVFADDTRAADNRAFWLKVRDVTIAAFDEKQFRKAVADLRATAERPILDADLIGVVTRTVETLELPPAAASPILSFLAAGGDLSQWGLGSAITRQAGEIEDYETSTVFERAGGALLALPAAQWATIAGVAA